MSAPSGGDAKKVILAAMAGNGGIALAKFVAAYFSGSTSMLAEGVHSVADTANQVLLFLGLRLSNVADPERHPFGRAKENYFWAFIVALLLFFIGGVYAIYEGIHELASVAGGHAAHGAAPHGAGAHAGPPWLDVGVLVVALFIELASFRVAWSEFQKARAGTPIGEALFGGRDPVIPVVLLEDAGAVAGLIVALAAVLATWLTGDVTWDAVGSIGIGVLLCLVGVLLANDTRSLLIGEGARPEVRRRVVELTEAVPGVERVNQLLTLHLGPQTALAALKLRFRSDASLSDVERMTDQIEEQIRGEYPMFKRIFVEADSDYDASLDGEVAALEPPAGRATT